MGVRSSKQKKIEIAALVETQVDEELEKAKHRYRPCGIDELVRKTSFTKKELQLLYRSFKEGSPNGIVSLENFHEIFCYIFPYGDATKYATCVFKTFDEDGNGEISFEEFATALSIISRGSQHEKLEWVFQLYDEGGKGYITRDDILRITAAMYALIGNKVYPPIYSTTPADHADFMFQKYDKDHDGKISMDDFIATCEKDITILQSMELFKFAYTRVQLAQYMGTPLQSPDDFCHTEPVLNLSARRRKVVVDHTPSSVEDHTDYFSVKSSLSAPQGFTYLRDSPH